MIQSINVKPKAVHRKQNAQTSRACRSKFILSHGMSVWGLRGRGPGTPAWAADSLADLLPAFRERAAESSFPASDWKAGRCSRVCSWQPGARGPAATSSRGGDVCAPDARAATEPRLCRRRGARPGRRPAPSRPGGGPEPSLGGTLAGAPDRSLGPAGRRGRAGVRGRP